MKNKVNQYIVFLLFFNISLIASYSCEKNQDRRSYWQRYFSCFSSPDAKESKIYPHENESNLRHDGYPDSSKHPLYIQTARSSDYDSPLLRGQLAKISDAVTASNNDSYTQLEDAIFKNDCNKIKILVNSGIDIDLCDGLGNTLLHLALAREDIDNNIVSYLLRRGASVNKLNNKNQTPLHYAVKNLNEPAVRMLIEYGANPNINDDDDYTPILLLLNKFILPRQQDQVDLQADIVHRLIEGGAIFDPEMILGIVRYKIKKYGMHPDIENYILNAQAIRDESNF